MVGSVWWVLDGGDSIRRMLSVMRFLFKRLIFIVGYEKIIWIFYLLMKVVSGFWSLFSKSCWRLSCIGCWGIRLFVYWIVVKLYLVCLFVLDCFDFCWYYIGLFKYVKFDFLVDLFMFMLIYVVFYVNFEYFVFNV